MIIKEEKIGNGNHWNVFKITILEDQMIRNVIHKRSIHAGSAPRIISIYDMISKSSLKTLTYMKLYDVNTLETEDLNSDPADGYFVSPNTVRSSPHCASILMKLIENRNVTDLELETCKEFDFKILMSDHSKIDNDKMYKKKLIYSEAERFVYNSKIDKLANLEEFIKNTLTDLISASELKLGLFMDAFFFRVNPVTTTIDYRIADFDGIICIRDTDTTVKELFAINKDHFETALHEFIIYFISDQHQEYYLKILKKLFI